MTNFEAPYGERHSYERLLLEEPQAEIDGLWMLNGQFFILCPTLAADPLAANGTPLIQQFEQYRTLGSAVSLVSEVPAGAVRVPPRTSAQLVLGIGEERTWSRLANDLGLILPRDFPSFDLSFDNALPGYVVTIARELNSDQVVAVQAAFEKLQIGFPFRTTVDLALEERAHRPRAQGDVSLRTTRRLGRDIGRDAKFLNDEDEDLLGHSSHGPFRPRASVAQRRVATCFRRFLGVLDRQPGCGKHPHVPALIRMCCGLDLWVERRWRRPRFEVGLRVVDRREVVATQLARRSPLPVVRVVVQQRKLSGSAEASGSVTLSVGLSARGVRPRCVTLVVIAFGIGHHAPVPLSDGQTYRTGLNA
jgi:hypothetical protein